MSKRTQVDIDQMAVPGDRQLKDDPNLERAKRIAATWPAWKRDYQITKYVQPDRGSIKK